jgi:hypothetical protein
MAFECLLRLVQWPEDPLILAREKNKQKKKVLSTTKAQMSVCIGIGYVSLSLIITRE